MQEEDKKSLQAVEDSEDIRHDEGLIAELKQAKDPGGTQNTELGNGCDCEYPAGMRRKGIVRISLCRGAREGLQLEAVLE